MEVRSSFRPAATVAVVDESVWRLRQLGDLLAPGAHRLLLLTSGKQAVTLLADGKVEVLVSVETMQEMRGSEICDALREKLGDRRPRFILLREPGEHLGRITASFDASVSRSAEADELLTAVADAVTHRRTALKPPPETAEE